MRSACVFGLAGVVAGAMSTSAGAQVLVNDHCASATQIGAGISFRSTNDGATSDIEQSPCSWYDSFDVWYAFVAGVNGDHTISVTSPRFVLDTTLVVMNCCGTSAVELACNDDANPFYGTDSAAVVPLTAGQSIRIRVAGYYLGQGPFDIMISPPLPRATPLGGCCHGSLCSLVSAEDCIGPSTRFAGSGTACNAPGVNSTPCCRADFNQNGVLNIEDVFEFIDQWLAGDPAARFAGGASLTVMDILS